MRWIISIMAVLLLAGCTNYTLPIETTAEAQSFVYEELPQCTGPDMTFESFLPVNASVDEYGYYGLKATTLIDPTDFGALDASGVIAYSIWFDPNNGWIRKLWCDPVYFVDCPDRINRPNSDNPNYEAYLELLPGPVEIVGYAYYAECRVELVQ